MILIDLRLASAGWAEAFEARNSRRSTSRASASAEAATPLKAEPKGVPTYLSAAGRHVMTLAWKVAAEASCTVRRSGMIERRTANGVFTMLLRVCDIASEDNASMGPDKPDEGPRARQLITLVKERAGDEEEIWWKGSPALWRGYRRDRAVPNERTKAPTEAGCSSVKSAMFLSAPRNSAHIACIQYESLDISVSRSFQVVNLAQTSYSRKDDEALLLE